MINKYDQNGKLKKKKESKLFNKFKSFLFSSDKDDVLLRGRKPKKVKEVSDIDIPTEVEILINRYHVDLSKINYKKLLKIVGLTCSIDIGLVVSIIFNLPIDNTIISILIGGLLSIPVILISYSILGKILKKKGLVKNEKNNKRNRK